jgi:hypothetical protein
VTAVFGAIAGGVFETGFASGETEAFFGFARAAILTLFAVEVVPGLAAEEVVFGAEIPGYGVGGLGGG